MELLIYGYIHKDLDDTSGRFIAVNLISTSHITHVYTHTRRIRSARPCDVMGVIEVAAVGLAHNKTKPTSWQSSRTFPKQCLDPRLDGCETQSQLKTTITNICFVHSE